MVFEYFTLFRRSSTHRILTFLITKRNHSGCLGQTNHPLENVNKVFSNRNHEYEMFSAYRAMPSYLVPCSFSKSYIPVIQYHYSEEDKKFVNIYTSHENKIRESKNYHVKFKSLFKEGFERVHSILNRLKDPMATPLENWSNNDQELYLALKRLDGFIHKKDFHEKCLFCLAEDNKNYSKLETTILLANHLFHPLVSCDIDDKSCLIMSNDAKQKNDVDECPCSQTCGKKSCYADTSFGSSRLWHGKIDIILFPSGRVGPPVAIMEETELQDHIKNTATQSAEVKTKSEQLRSISSESQAASQAVTYSFYQRHYQKQKKEFKNSVTTLIPTISMSGTHFDIYFYDSENDILLRNYDYHNISGEENENSPLPIFKLVKTRSVEEGKVKPFKTVTETVSCEFDLNSVLLLWMSINHLLLQPKILNGNQLNLIRESCGIKKTLENEGLQIEEIEKDVKFHRISELKNIKEKIKNKRIILEF